MRVGASTPWRSFCPVVSEKPQYRKPSFRELAEPATGLPRMSYLGSSLNRANIASGLGCWHHARKTLHGGTSRGL